jgi:hypothetical protein
MRLIMVFVFHSRRHWTGLANLLFNGGGPKGPPSAPPAIPPIIINPFCYEQPGPAIDPRITPLGPPIRPPRRPELHFEALSE